MHHQHNPIAQIIDKMQACWLQQVQPETALVRWLLKAGDHRMYEGFCRLESSPHGRIDELFVFFYTPFQHAERYSRDVLENWLQEIKENQAAPGADITRFDAEAFEKRLAGADSCQSDILLLELMEQFRHLLAGPLRPLVLAILPKTIQSPAGMAQWINRFAQQEIPIGLRLLVFDHSSGNYWQPVFDQYPDRSVTLEMDLQLEEAIKAIATGGDPRSPDVQFRRCMYAMGEAAARKEVSTLHECGKKMLDIGAGSGQPNLHATAYITYAGMLFTFKAFDTVHPLLSKGIQLCQQAIAAGDTGIRPLLLQFYGYRAAAFQHQKDSKKAMECFLQQGREAVQYGLYAESIGAYHKAFLMAQFRNKYQDQVQALHEALGSTPFLEPATIRSTEYPYIAYEYAQLVQLRIPGADGATEAMAAAAMETAYGPGWKETVREMKMNFNRQELQLKETAARVA
jgi:tetratricopeptide (TPR) repeat protein